MPPFPSSQQPMLLAGPSLLRSLIKPHHYSWHTSTNGLQCPRSPVQCLHSGNLGWGLLSKFPPFRYFPNFSALPKYMLVIEYHVHIWQVLLQLNCGDTCHIWTWCKESNRCLDRIENFAYGEINEQSFSNPQTRGSGTFRWLSARLQYLQCISNGDTAVLH